MAKHNTLYMNNEELHDVIIKTDANGYNTIKIMNNLKYNRLVNSRIAACTMKKNIVLVNETEICDTIIITDEAGSNILKTIDDIKTNDDEKEGNIFKETLLKIHNEKSQQNNSIDTYLCQKRNSVQVKLKLANDYYNSHYFDEASELYQDIVNIIENDNYPDEFMLNIYDILAIKIANILCKISTNNYGDLSTAGDILNNLISNYGDKFPILYYYLAKVFFNLQNYDKAKQTLENGLLILHNIENTTKLYWPGNSDKIIEDTEKLHLVNVMETLHKDCQIFRLPDATCYFSNCTFERNNIFFNCPSFQGYVSLKCTNKCNFKYHRSCWKMKLKSEGIKKTTSFFSKICKTDDCGGFNSEIVIYDGNLHVNRTIVPKSSLEIGLVDKNVCKIEKEDSQNECIFKPPERQVAKRLKNETQKNVPDLKIKESISKKFQCKTEEISNIDEKSSKLLIESKIESCKEKIEKSDKKEVHLANNTDKTLNKLLKSNLNTNAKEYIPLNKSKSCRDEKSVHVATENIHSQFQKGSSLNLHAKEYVPIQNNNHVISEIKQNSEKKILVDYIYNDHYVIHKSIQTDPRKCFTVSTQSFIDSCEKCTQFSCNDSEEMNFLKCEISVLNKQLFESEEAYNDLLLEYNTLKEKNDYSKHESVPSLNISTQTTKSIEKETSSCKKCIKMINEIIHKRNEYSTMTCLVEDLQEKNKNLLQEMNELNSSLLLERECYSESQRKFAHENDILKRNLFDLEKQVAFLRKEYNDYKSNNYMLIMKKVLLEQINLIRDAYLLYYTMFDNKCQYMLRELNDLKSLTTAESFPSNNEIEDNFDMWSKALEDAKKIREITKEFFENLYKNFSFDQFNEKLLAIPLPHLISEPTSVMIRDFKSILVLNKRLEQELNSRMMSFYNMISTPYSGIYPQNQTIQKPITSTNDSNFVKKFDIDIQTVEETNRILKNENPTELYRNTSPIKTNTGTIPKKINNSLAQTVISPAADDNKNKIPTPTKPIKDLVGLDSLLLMLQKQFPVVPPRKLTDAVQILRNSNGGLTGMDSRGILFEVKKILREQSEKDKCRRQGVEKPQTGAWSKINNVVQWQSENPDVNCIICFEYLDRKTRVQLRCQHMFHTECIKKWLQNDSICPICRSFTTLDDEFPPLK